MKSKYFLYTFTMVSVVLLLTGCGEKTVGDTFSTKLAQSQTCIDCHEGQISPGSRNSVVDEWKLSRHNLRSGAGCADCHEPEAGHPTSCNRCHGVTPSGAPSSANHVSRNPDHDGTCAKCHNGTLNGIFKFTTYDGVTLDTKFLHYSTGRRTSFVATNYRNNCRKCHNPHDTSFGRDQRQQWARSGHGNSLTNARTSRPFQAFGSSTPADSSFGSYCVRCHTSTGYINFINSNFSDVQALPDLNGVRTNYPQWRATNSALGRFTSAQGAYVYNDSSREATNCDVCHSDRRTTDGSAYSGKLRPVPAFSVWYLYSSHPQGVTDTIRAKLNVQFDDLGGSNSCTVCHSGREGGDLIKIADIDWDLFGYTGTSTATRPGGITPHDFAAGGNLEGKSGFNFYTSSAKYEKNPTHKKESTSIGGANGACIGCHMRNDRPHYFLPVSWKNDDQSQAIISVRSEPTVCIKCHDGSAGKPRRDVTLMNTQRDGYRAAVVALNRLIRVKVNGGITISSSTNNWKILGNNPVPGSGVQSTTSATIKLVRGGAYTMGTNFVYNLFFADPGGYVHNPTYTKQQIYDSIDWLADGAMDFGGVNTTQVFNAISGLDTASAPLTWVKNGVTYGQNGVINGLPFTKDQALNFICKDYVSGSFVCNRW
ncbi:MAG: hypothetical protein JJE30_12215 [Desulfuromonadales bacterium]|nr:hypothetical protein [Desulfuromonadales bacterium]